MKFEEFLRKYFIKVTAVLLLIFLADIFILGFGVMKLQKKAGDLAQKADAGKKDLKALDEKVLDKESEVRKLSEGKLIIETLTQRIFQKRSERFIEFQKEIQKLVSEAGMMTDSYNYKYSIAPKNFEKENWKNGYVEVDMSLPLQGSYPQIKKLIGAIEDSGHFITINGISLSQTNQGAAILDFKVSITTYFVFDPAEDFSGDDK